MRAARQSNRSHRLGRRSGRQFTGSHFEQLDARRLLSASLTFGGAQAITPGATINVSNDNSFSQSGMLMDVNPTNPLSLAGIVQHVGGQNEIDVYRSNDGGTTWAKTAIDNGAAGVNDGSGAGTRFNPAIAYDDNGNLYVAYSNDTGTSTSIVFGRSSDNGATFYGFRTLSTNADIYNGTIAEIHGNDQVSLATGPDGLGGRAVYVASVKSVIETGVGLDQRVMLDASNNGGTTFLGGIIVNNQSVIGADPENVTTDVAVGPNGQVYMVWHNVNIDTGVERLMFDRDLDGRFVATSNFGTDAVAKNFANGSLTGWLVPAQPDHGVYTDPTLAVDRSGGAYNGRVYLSYVDQTNVSSALDTDVHVARYNGSSWTDAGVFASAGSEFNPQVAVDQHSGAVGVAFYSSYLSQIAGNGSVDARMALSTDGGATWTAAVVGDTHSSETGGYAGDYSDHMGLAMRDGTAHVFWAARHLVGTDLDAFTATVGFFSATGGNVASTVHEYIGDQLGAYTSITRSGDYLVVTTGPGTQEAFLASTVDSVVVNGAYNANNTVWIDAPPSGINLTVNGGRWDDYLNVVSMPAGVPTTFNGDLGEDYASVSTNDKNLDLIHSDFTFSGGDGADQLYVYDGSSTDGKLYTVTNGSVSRANVGTVYYGGDTEYVNLYAGRGSDQVNVNGTRAGTTVDVFLGEGDDAAYVGAGNFGAVQGWVRINGGSGDDLVAVVDNSTAGSDHYTISATDIQRSGADAVTFLEAEEMYLFAEKGNNLITVISTAPGCLFYLRGGGGTDTYDVQSTDVTSPAVIDATDGGDDSVNINTDNTGTAKVVFPYSVRIGALTVGNGGLAQLAPADPGDDHVLTATSVSFGTGQLDLTDGSLILDYTGPATTPIASVRDALTSGYFGGAWTGAGIISSTAAADAAHRTALGCAEATDVLSLFPAPFHGGRVDNTSVLVTYTLYGDANLDRKVDLTDFTYLAANFNGEQKGWNRGDFNYDARVDLTDFTFLASNFNRALPVIAAPAATPAMAATPATLDRIVEAALPARSSSPFSTERLNRDVHLVELL